MFTQPQQLVPPIAVSGSHPVTPHHIPSLKPGLFSMLVNGVPVATYSNKDYDFSYLSVGHGPLHLEISASFLINRAHVSPLKFDITPTISGDKLSATLPGPGYYIIQIGASNRLVVLADSCLLHPTASSGVGVWNVQGHGAAPDGTSISLTTAAFQSCLDAASASSDPNALVFVPPGLYAVGNLVLKSNSTLYLSPGATLRFSPEEKGSYKIHWHKDSQGRRPITWWISTAFGSRNIRVFGSGVLDGNGVAAARAGIGNNLLVPIATDRFSCEGLLFLNSASWACTPIMVTDGTFRDCKFVNRFSEAGENDGIDVMHSENIVVSRAVGIGLDDPFSTKTWCSESDIAASWPLPDGGQPPALRGVSFDDTLSWTICFGIKVGAGMWSPQEDIAFRNAVVYDSSIAVGIHFHSGSSRAKGVLFEDIDVENVTWTNMNISCWCALMVTGGGAGEEPPIQDVVVSDVLVRMSGRRHAVLAGQQGRAIERVEFKSVVMPGSTRPAETLEDMRFEGVKYVRNITIS